MRLEGRRALVTGGSRSIGQAIAVGLAREGADVVVNYRQDRQAAERTAAAIRAHGRQAAVEVLPLGGRHGAWWLGSEI
jgi:NAD(P)-dependent dehydrogenase (short-subunit alcohol dehydrogenase family)